MTRDEVVAFGQLVNVYALDTTGRCLKIEDGELRRTRQKRFLTRMALSCLSDRINCPWAGAVFFYNPLSRRVGIVVVPALGDDF